MKTKDKGQDPIVASEFNTSEVSVDTSNNDNNKTINSNKNGKKNFFVRVWNYFSTYEKIWFFSIVALSILFAFLFPEEEVNGVNGSIIMVLYLIDIFSNVLCELLISKQSKWNFIVSLVVELTEIATLIILAARFATMAVTLFFWIPIDIISFINWNRHTDDKDEDLTVVRTLKWWQTILVVIGIIVWTMGVGYLMAAYAPDTDFYSSELIEVIVCYIDACASVVGIANGLFILFRYREQWLAWYICAGLETAINILSGQWVLLVLKAGYFTNTTYGYIKWTKYIKSHSNTSIYGKPAVNSVNNVSQSKLSDNQSDQTK